MPGAVTAAQILVAALFLVAATGKYLSRADFERTLTESRFPRWLTPFAVRAVPATEAVLAVTIIAFASSPVPLAVAAVFLLALTGWLVDVLRRGVSVPCACFGAGGREPVTARAVARNAVLLLLCGGAAVGVAAAGTALPAHDMWTGLTAAGLGTAVVLATALRAAFPHLMLRFPRNEQEGGVA